MKIIKMQLLSVKGLILNDKVWRLSVKSQILIQIEI